MGGEWGRAGRKRPVLYVYKHVYTSPTVTVKQFVHCRHKAASLNNEVYKKNKKKAHDHMYLFNCWQRRQHQQLLL